LSGMRAVRDDANNSMLLDLSGACASGAGTGRGRKSCVLRKHKIQELSFTTP